ncbi:lasso peptide biosynthesis B2 protein [Calothrix sp. PCC 6303]|uniref:lasso peptide biosynthesis B2 protein n=1 Tax=Calothrix sp. PCC 6303 TaxID=1170562 RepID=UPI0002A00CE3|nr:lasso peptide biosynthesis B2 protein [Calothrix sp. PCC 6303]AFY99914.1 hypothetical protein Cal6303_0849 [Calothrix sp. PCC 6303]
MGCFKFIKSKVLTFNALSRQEHLLFFRSLFLLPIVAFSLQLWGMQSTQKFLAQISQKTILSSTVATSLLLAKTTSTMVNLAARYSPLWGNCLKKSLVLWYLLRCQGIMSELRIGVRRENGEFQAHAWIEHAGVVLNDTPYVYQQFTTFAQAIEVKT